MKPVERVLADLRLQEPDRVPHYEWEYNSKTIRSLTGGYVCFSINMIHSGVNPELYRVMVKTIHSYGQYPLDLDRLAPAS